MNKLQTGVLIPWFLFTEKNTDVGCIQFISMTFESVFWYLLRNLHSEKYRMNGFIFVSTIAST